MDHSKSDRDNTGLRQVEDFIILTMAESILRGKTKKDWIFLMADNL